jgi:hypothetical protein
VLLCTGPGVWFNPKAHTLPPLYRSPGLAQKDIEVTLPLTPHHLLLISHHRSPQYVDVERPVVDEQNRCIRFHCTEEFVSKSAETRVIWFDRGTEPPDTWEQSEEGKAALANRDRIVGSLLGREEKESE